ncbi:MAG: HDIG domain-containing metalloprotein [Coriobacteriia bacterium]
MSRYSEISSRAFNHLPERLRTPFAGRFIVFAVVASIAVGIVIIGALAALLGDMVDGTSADVAFDSALWGALGAATATLLALIVIPFVRDGLGLAEDIRLLEAASPAHPLLRELITAAPGTYTHSVATANLAEAAAEELGADALVTRVGAYYHDVGKIKRPVYFFENQSGGSNPHDEAKPQLSALIITAHVHDGLVLAEKYNLPPKIRDIIRQHHGTSLVRYFYNKAAVLDAEVFEADFRYQGEHPTSREAALVMLADSCEAAVRALKEPTEPRVEAVVRSIVDDKVADEQLDEVDLTSSELDQIVAIYSHMLVSMYHARCEYPPAPDKTRRTLDVDQHHQPSRA